MQRVRNLSGSMADRLSDASIKVCACVCVCLCVCVGSPAHIPVFWLASGDLIDLRENSCCLC